MLHSPNVAIKFAGTAGFGITTVGAEVGKIFARLGYKTYDYCEFPSLIRGGFTSTEIVVGDTHFDATTPSLDILVLLRVQELERNMNRLTPNTIVLYDDTFVIPDEQLKVAVFVPAPLRAIKLKHKAFIVMVNTVSAAFVLEACGVEDTEFLEGIKKQFARKGADVVEHNIALALEGTNLARERLSASEAFKKSSDAIKSKLGRMTRVQQKQMYATGNDYFALSSIAAGLKGYFAYPMSPASSVLTTLASLQRKAKVVVHHVEDEISAINQALGFAWTGARAATGSSGGGFALMVEAISYAGVAEIPIVILLSQRPGPATGLPTWTAQGDLMFAVHSGHGEFPKIVLAPYDAESLVELTCKAYDLADYYQLPVIVLVDKLLSESHYTYPREVFLQKAKSYIPNRGKMLETASSGYKRYKLESDGISPWLRPGASKETFWQANSYEHSEDSHTTEDPDVVESQVMKRMAKMTTYIKNPTLGFVPPKITGQSSLVFVTWGSTYGVVAQSIDILRSQNVEVAHMHFTHLYPLDAKAVSKQFKKDARYFFIECNATNQLHKLLGQEGCLSADTKCHKFQKYTGAPIQVDEVIQFFYNELKNL